jgi:hypothetical protein
VDGDRTAGVCNTQPGDGGLVSLAADADVAVASFGCTQGELTQRLNLTTGAAAWTTPLYSGGESQLLAVPANTGTVVIPEMGNGTYIEGPIRQWIPTGVHRGAHLRNPLT